MPIDNVRFEMPEMPEIRVERVFNDFDQPVNPNTGQPNGPSRLSRCTITLHLTADDSLEEIYKWEKDYSLTLDVKVHFYDQNNLVKSDTYQQVFLTSVESLTSYSPQGGVQRSLVLHLNPMKATIENVFFDLTAAA